MSARTVYRCKAVKPNGERVDGCGWQGGEPARALVVDRCPSCGSPHLAIVEPHAAVRAIAQRGFAIDLQIAPGIWIRADGSADGPGLEAALAMAADVATLDAWAWELSEDDRRCQGHEPEHWQEQGVTAYCDGSCMRGRKRHRPQHWWVEAAMTASGQPGFAVGTEDGDAFPIAVEGEANAARRAAADAIRNGRTSSP